MLTVPEAARRVGRNPETVRRWIRAGRLRSQRVGTQHLIDEGDLDALVSDEDEMLPLPDHLKKTRWGAAQPNWVRIVRRSREAH
jgi:excisionase family DNA binding protein